MSKKHLSQKIDCLLARPARAFYILIVTSVSLTSNEPREIIRPFGNYFVLHRKIFKHFIPRKKRLSKKIKSPDTREIAQSF